MWGGGGTGCYFFPNSPLSSTILEFAVHIGAQDGFRNLLYCQPKIDLVKIYQRRTLWKKLAFTIEKKMFLNVF